MLLLSGGRGNSTNNLSCRPLGSWFDARGRDIRGQLERALQEAEALRADNVTFKSRANAAEKGKADLEAR